LCCQAIKSVALIHCSFALVSELLKSPLLAAIGVASGLYHGMLCSAALIGLLTVCGNPADAETCGKARSMLTHSGVALVGCVALVGVSVRANRG
tara:strand:- start:219 stop:500 length:282 start_codon:yes stop_codon:yes gene_type:complete